jgi:hypothetical protein
MNPKSFSELSFCIRAVIACLVTVAIALGAMAQTTNSSDKTFANTHDSQEDNRLREAAGPIAEGFHLTLSFEKASFTNGEPIVGVVSLRNITNRVLDYYANIRPYREIVVTDDAGQVLVSKAQASMTEIEKRLSKIVRNPQPSTVEPKDVSEYTIQLDESYDLVKPGKYVVHATQIVPTLDHKGRVRLVSSNASFTLVATNGVSK